MPACTEERIERLPLADNTFRRRMARNPQSVLMTEIVPHGHISVCEAVNHLGPELFPEAWTGHEARRGPARIARRGSLPFVHHMRQS
jgi:hypothetical protein